MQSTAQGAAILLFAAWLAISIVCQLSRKAENWLRDRDLFSLIPRWNFFAPNPSMQDFHLLYRDRYPDGSVGRWSEPPRMKPNPIVSAFWNPGRRYNKALFDVTQHLLRASETLASSPLRLQLTLPYVVLLNYVSGFPRWDGAIETQFLLMTSYGRQSPDKPTPVFVSALHQIEPVPSR